MLHRSGDYTEETIKEEALCHCTTLEHQIVIYTLEKTEMHHMKTVGFSDILQQNAHKSEILHFYNLNDFFFLNRKIEATPAVYHNQILPSILEWGLQD